MLNAQQLVWRCRRGIRELDVLLARFLESEYPQLSARERLAFERLLEVQDPVIMDWLFGKASSDDHELMQIIGRLKSISGLDND